MLERRSDEVLWMRDSPVAQNTIFIVDVCDFRGDDRCVHEPLVGNTQPALGLVLLPLARLPGSSDLLERSCWNSVVLDPTSIT